MKCVGYLYSDAIANLKADFHCVYVPHTSRALEVRGTRVIRPFDACVRSNQTHRYLRKKSHCVRGMFVARTSGPFLDAEIKMSLISALSVRFLTQQTHVLSVARTLHV
jgi:hypothetical protein